MFRNVSKIVERNTKKNKKTVNFDYEFYSEHLLGELLKKYVALYLLKETNVFNKKLLKPINFIQNVPRSSFPVALKFCT